MFPLNCLLGDGKDIQPGKTAICPQMFFSGNKWRKKIDGLLGNPLSPEK